MKTALFLILLLIIGLGVGKLFFIGYRKFTQDDSSKPGSVAEPRAATAETAKDEVKEKMVELTCTGYLLRGGRFIVFLSDGTKLQPRDKVVEVIDSDRVRVSGRWIPVKIPRRALSDNAVIKPLFPPLLGK